MRRILLDTSALFSSLDPDDRNHQRARAFLRTYRAILVVPDTIFVEAMTLIKRHLGVAVAIQTGTTLLNDSLFQPYRLTQEDVNETWRIFCRYTDKDWSYTDCSLLALSRRLSIEAVFAFDRHFDQMVPLGLQRLPEL